MILFNEYTAPAAGYIVSSEVRDLKGGIRPFAWPKDRGSMCVPDSV